jgi:hypothetical protein
MSVQHLWTVGGQAMNRPRLPIRAATTSPVAVQQALIHLCQQVPGAVLVSTLSLTQKQTSHAQLRDFRGFVVKNARISLFNVICTKVFTSFCPSKALRERNIRIGKFKTSGVQTAKTGGSDLTFSAFSRPKCSRGRSLPLVPTSQVTHCTPAKHLRAAA